MSWIRDEIATLDADGYWVRTGQWFKAHRIQQPGTQPMCRFSDGDWHLFGVGRIECEALRESNPRFTLESPNLTVYVSRPVNSTCPENTSAVYRVFNNRPDANYRYTTDKLVRDAMLAKGWVTEPAEPVAMAMCAPN